MNTNERIARLEQPCKAVVKRSQTNRLTIDERLKRLEKQLGDLQRGSSEEQQLTRLEVLSVKVTLFIMLMFGLTALVFWGWYELISFLIHLWISLSTLLGR